ncbi:MAG: hypothetical protein IJZ73_03605 [Clostridia bacterium]|nr:hypothetical protein [Clostridia bacterium]
MAKGKVSGFINRLIAGKEKSEGYARASLPSNRWELFWDILKGRIGKLVLLNLLVALFFIPLFLLVMLYQSRTMALGATSQFNVFGVGYSMPISVNGLAENISFSNNIYVLLLLPICAIIASVGISGGAYVMRNMVWTEGIFMANDFWRGVKQNFKQIVLIVLVYSLLLYAGIAGISVIDVIVAMDPSKAWLFITLKVITIIILGLYSIMTLHMITMSVTYELKFSQLIKNAFLFTIALFFQNIFFGAISSAFVILFFVSGEVLQGISLVAMLVIGFSFFLLVWTNYCQWAFDRYVNDKVKGAKKNKGIYEKVKAQDGGALQKYKEQIEISTATMLARKPIKPINDEELTIAELPVSFNRSDLEKLRESKEAIYKDNEQYIEQHRDDPRYAEYFKEKDGVVEETNGKKDKRVEKAKRELEKRNRKKR